MFCFLGAKSRVNNWATIGSITGPRVGPCFEAHVAQLLTQEVCLKMFFEASCFLKSSFSLQEEEHNKQRNQKTVAQFLTQQRAPCGPAIDPTIYIYTYANINIYIYTHRYIYLDALKEKISRGGMHNRDAPSRVTKQMTTRLATTQTATTSTQQILTT